MDPIQRLQHHQYEFPYHHLAQLSGKGFSTFRNWGWSSNYAVALRLVLETLERLETRSHVDIGCGDGALISQLAHAMPLERLAGIDYDERAIRFAGAFTPEADIVTGDIRTHRWSEPFDTASLIEVVEHIPPAEIKGVMAGVKDVIRPGGRLIVTVPHVNKPLQDKHYQHFDFASLTEALAPHFAVETIFGFERPTIGKKVWKRLTDNRFWFAELPIANRTLLARELAYRDTAEKGCGRIFAVAVPT